MKKLPFLDGSFYFLLQIPFEFLVPILFPREESRDFFLVVGVFRILRRRNLFGKRRPPKEKNNKKQRPGDAPIEDIAGIIKRQGADAEEIERDPNPLLREIIGMAAHTPKTNRIEAFVIGRGKIDQVLFACKKRPFCGLKSPLLLIGDRFINQKRQHKGRRQIIHPTKRRGRIDRSQGRQRNEKHQSILIDRNEEEIKKSPFPARLELFFRTENLPSVILFPLPKFQMIGPFPGKIESQANPPKGG